MRSTQDGRRSRKSGTRRGMTRVHVRRTGHGRSRQARKVRKPVAGLPELRRGQSWYGWATTLGILESDGPTRRVRVGGLKHLHRRPAQRPRHDLVNHASDEWLAKVLSAFANPHRVAIMKAIFTGAGSYAELRKRVGLKAGPMYHHLRELRLAGMLADGSRDMYDLTTQGRDLLAIMCSLPSLIDQGSSEAASSGRGTLVLGPT